MSKRGVNPVLLVLISIASVQLGASFAKGVFEDASPMGLALLRAGIASLILLAIVRPSLRGHTAKDWVVAAAYGLSLTGMNLAIYLSFERIPIGVAVTLEFIGPLMLAVVGTRRVVDLIWVALAALGVALLGSLPGGIDPVGVALALLAGVLWASYIALAGPLGARWRGLDGLATGSTIGALLLLVPTLVLSPTGLGNPHVLLIGAAVALLSSVIPFALELNARRSIKASTFSILMSLEPAAAALFAWLVLREGLGYIELVAMAAVVIASIGAVRSARRIGEGKETTGHAGAEGA